MQHPLVTTSAPRESRSTRKRPLEQADHSVAVPPPSAPSTAAVEEAPLTTRALPPNAMNKRVKRSVQFSSDPPQVHTAPNEVLDEATCNLLWYQNAEYNEFLKDRIATIRVFRTLHGDSENNGLEDYYCLRGLEPYQSPSLHADIAAHRILYAQTLLEEQKRFKNDISFLERIRPHLQSLSSWATLRAQNLAVMDAADAMSVWKPNNKKSKATRRRSCITTTMDTSVPTNRYLKLSRRASLPPLQPQQQQQQQVPLPAPVPQPPTELDLMQLKEMNRLLLQRLTRGAATPQPLLNSVWTNIPAVPKDELKDPAARLNDTVNFPLSELKDLCVPPSQPSLRANDEHEKMAGNGHSNMTNKGSSTMSLNALLREGSGTAAQRYTALSRRLLQDQRYQMLRRDSLRVGANNNHNNHSYK